MHSLSAVIFIAYLTCMLEAKPSSHIVKMPPNCEYNNYCYETKGYPQEEIDKIVSELSIEAGQTTEHRTSSNSDESYQPCETTNPNVDPIHYIRIDNGDVRYVVQSANFKQIIRVVKCRNPGLVKNGVTPFSDLKMVCQYNVSCVEDLVPINFLVMTRDMSGVEVATIKDGLPMACSCRYTDPSVTQPQNCPGISDYINDDYAEYLKTLDAEEGQ